MKEVRLPKTTPDKYVAWAGIDRAYSNANNVIGQAKASGYVSLFWEQVRRICILKGVLNEVA